MTLDKVRWSTAMNACWRYACRGIVAAMLSCISLAQTAPPAPGVAPPNTLAVSPTRVTRVTMLPDAPIALTSTTKFASQSLHLLVGRSIFITTLSRLKRIYVSNPAVVDSFTSSPTQIVITAKAAGMSTLILWDETGKSGSYLISSDLDVASLQREIREALPNDDIYVQAQEDRVSLSGTVLSEASSDAAFKLASLYGKNIANSLVVRPVHIRQVRLKVQMIEVDRSKGAQFGINLFSEGKNQSNVTTGQFPSTVTYTPASGATASTITSSNPLNLLFYNFGLNIGLTLQDLEDKQIAQILAEPTITTLSGQKASFLSGGEFPFPVVQGSSGGTTSITIQFRPYGVKLDFTPIVNDDGTIQLKVAPEVSALDFTNAVTISGYTIPAIATRRAETQVELRSGQSFAISGLLDHRTTDIFNKMPGIGDVPVLGQLFRSKNVSHSTVELMVLVTPTVVDPLTDTTTPDPPKLPVPMLDPAQFDKNTEKHKRTTQPGTGGTP
jgi:pilus assembly protein CpaC